MKKIFFILSFIFTLNSLFSQTGHFYLEIPAGYEIPTILSPGTNPLVLRTYNTNINQIFARYTIYEFKKAFPTAKTPFLQEIYEIKCNDITLMQELINSQSFPYAEEIGDPIATYTPNDYSLSLEQTNLDLIRAQDAWNITKGNPNIHIGITDTYVEPTHEDLQSQIYQILQNNYPIQSEWFHGVAVAGCAAASTDNGKGLAGIANKCKIVFTSDRSDNSMLLLSQMGIRVINASWYTTCDSFLIPSKVYKEIKENGTICVFGAGNKTNHCGSLSAKVYPASYSTCISVTSVGHMYPIGYIHPTLGQVEWKDCHEEVVGNPTTAHHHNNAVDICAPGYNVPTTMLNNTYGGAWGTSFAAPQVTGVIALMLSVNPCLTWDETVNLLKSSAIVIDTMPQNLAYKGLLGAGRVDAYNAVLAVQNYGITPPISNHIIWNKEKYVKGNLVIEKNGILEITSNVRFSKESKLIVNPGAKLIIDGGKLTNNCGGTWQGITLLGSKNHPQVSALQGTVEITNGGTIENAVCGVYVGNPENPGDQSSGGILRVNGGIFRDCQTGISFAQYHRFEKPNLNSRRPAWKVNNIGYVRNSTFESSDLLAHSGISPVSGISIWDVDGVDISGNTFINYNTGNYQIGRGCGIRMTDGNLTANNNTFQNLSSGVQSSTTNILSSVELDNNTFTNCDFGIMLKPSFVNFITRNKFNFTDYSQNTPIGIYSDYSRGLSITENEFTGLPKYDSYGIYILNNQTADNLYKNIFTDIAFPLRSAYSDQLQFECNEFYGMSNTGIYIDKGGAAPSQGSKTLSAGNQFFLSNRNYDIYSFSDFITYFTDINNAPPRYL